MNEITWKLDLQVKEGPKFTLNDVIKVEAYDKVDVVVPAQGGLVVNVQPGGLEQVELIFIYRTTKPEAEEKPTTFWYRIGNSGERVYLKSVHVLLGPGSVKLLCLVPNCLYFTNEHTKDINVTILVGRRASPCNTDAEGDETTQSAEDTRKTMTASGSSKAGATAGGS